MIPYFVCCTQYASSCLGALVAHGTDNTTLPVLYHAWHVWHGLILDVYSYPHVELCRGVITPNVGSEARICATWAGRNITPVMCVDAHVIPCISIAFVDWLCGARLAYLIVVVCRLCLPYCDVDAYSTHAGHTSIMRARSSSSHL